MDEFKTDLNMFGLGKEKPTFGYFPRSTNV